MFHIVFNADENYIKYNAVLIMSIIKAALVADMRQQEANNPPPPRKILKLKNHEPFVSIF